MIDITPTMTAEEKRTKFCRWVLEEAADPTHPWHDKFDWTDTPQAAAIRRMLTEEEVVLAGCQFAHGNFYIPIVLLDLLDHAVSKQSMLN